MFKKLLIGLGVTMSIGAWWVFKPKTLDENGRNLIKSFEGLSLTVYDDAAGLPTIGYGHLLVDGENYKRITQDEADILFNRDVARFEVAVNENVKVPITQNMFNGLVSFAYNVGIGAFKDSTLLRVLNGGDYIEAVNQLSRWNKAGGAFVQGLANRREQEQEVFFS